jgi:hypothetical protein
VADEQPQSYRRRNVALAVIAGVFVVAAIFKVVHTAAPAPASDAQGPVAASSAPAAQPTAAAQSSSAPASSDTGAAITAEVTYAGANDALPDAAKVYVFIRPVGERMPLGVQTYGVRDLPVAVEFSSPPGTTEARPVEVVARLSFSGAVTLQPGDLETVSGPLQFGQAPQSLSLTLGGAGGAGAATAVAPAAASATSSASPTGGSGAPAGAAVPAGTASPTGTVSGGTGVLRIPVHLALGPGVTLPPETTVFLIVRATDGSPMPLAVKRFVVSDLPKDLSLSEADAMVPGRSIRAAATVELVARASRSGNVKPASGDYEGRSGVLKIADISAPIALLIDRPL